MALGGRQGLVDKGMRGATAGVSFSLRDLVLRCHDTAFVIVTQGVKIEKSDSLTLRAREPGIAAALGFPEKNPPCREKIEKSAIMIKIDTSAGGKRWPTTISARSSTI
jgi:hypothetical protein